MPMKVCPRFSVDGSEAKVGAQDGSVRHEKKSYGTLYVFHSSFFDYALEYIAPSMR